MPGTLRRLWDARVLPHLVERACKSHAILEERTRWVPRAAGDVLEVGVGSGLNLGFYDPARVRAVIGLDPSAPLLAKAGPRAAAARVPVRLVEGDAQALPFESGRFDSVVLTYTLCSVPSPARALAEIRRVLRPGGELIFVEHGRSPEPRTYRWQRRLTPLWSRVAGNCHLDRDVAAELAAAGFACPELRAARAEEGPSWLSFTYEGSARVAAPGDQGR